MKKLLAVMLMLGCAAFVSACEPDGEGVSYTAEPASASAVPPPSFAHFTDIPVPDKSIMNVEKTFILGAGERWTGRLAYASSFSPASLFDFYMSEMPRFGWQEITVVRAQYSVITFKRDNRIATVQIYGDKSSGTFVDLTVSPQGAISAQALPSVDSSTALVPISQPKAAPKSTKR